MKPLLLNRHRNVERTTALVLAGWATFIAVASYCNLFVRLPLPSIAVLVVLGISVPLVIYFRNSVFRDYIASLHPRSLVALHLWRIGAGFVFLYYGSQELLPHRFVLNAGYGDLAVGLMVPMILLKQSIWKYTLFHIFGLLDFAVAVGTGLWFTLLQVPLMETIATFPLVLIPLFGVPISGASSIMALDSLMKHWLKKQAA